MSARSLVGRLVGLVSLPFVTFATIAAPEMVMAPPPIDRSEEVVAPVDVDATLREAAAARASGQLERAEDQLRLALDAAREQQGGKDAATESVAAQLAELLEQQGRYAEATPLRVEVVAIDRHRLGENDPQTGSAFQLLGANLAADGRCEQAIPYQQRAVEIATNAVPPGDADAADAHADLGDCLSRLGMFDDAAVHLNSALGIRERIFGPVHPLTADSRTGIGANLNRRGHPLEARIALEQALDIRRRLNAAPDRHVAVTYDQLALALDRLGRHAEAHPMFVTALQIEYQVLPRDHPQLLTTLDHLVRNLIEQDRYPEAMSVALDNLQIDRDQLGEEAYATGEAYATLGQVYLAFGEPRSALPNLQRSLAIRRRVLGDDHPETLTLRSMLATALAQTGDPDGAIATAASVAELRLRLLGDDHPETAASHADLADLEVDVPGHQDDAIADARAATRYWLRQRSGGAARLTDDAQQLRDSRNASRSFKLLADALWVARPPTSVADDESFVALQEAVVSSTGQSLAQLGARLGSRNPELQRLIRERQDLANQWRVVDSRMLAALSSRDVTMTQDERSHQASLLREQSEQVHASLEELDARLLKSYPGYFDLVSPNPLLTTDVQSILRSDEALLLVLPGRRGTHVVGISKGASRWARSPWNDARVSESVRILRCNLDPEHCSGHGDAASMLRGATRDDAPSAARHVHGFDLAAAYELYQQVVTPVLPAIQNKRVVYIVTTGALSSLPFSVLVTAPPAEGEDNTDPQVLRRTPWLLRKFALVTLPTVASLKLLHTIDAGASIGGSGHPEFVGIGDPQLGDSTAAESRTTRGAQLFSGLGANGMGLADPEVIRRSFRPLPGTRVELEAMGTTFAPRSRLLIGRNATEAHVKQESYEGVRVLAFSTHGIVAGEMEGVAEPALVLTPPVAPTELDDGLLTASEVAQLHLDADWVLLSACNTAASDGTPGADPLSGLTRAFMYAGAKSVLVSHWPVRDDVASALTVDAIRRQKAHPELGRAQAVRQATLEILDASARGQPSLADPSAWAPFSLVGEGR